MVLTVLLSLYWEEKRKKSCHDKQKNGNLKFCPSGVIAIDGLQGGLASLLAFIGSW